MAYAFSRAPLSETLNEQFEGEWKYLQKSCFDLAEERADRALLEMATQLRLLDTRQNLTKLFKRMRSEAFGIVVQADGSQTELHFRDMTNKIIHAVQFEWVCADTKKPVIICHSADPNRWQRAEINLLALAALCGEIMF